MERTALSLCALLWLCNVQRGSRDTGHRTQATGLGGSCPFWPANLMDITPAPRRPGSVCFCALCQPPASALITSAHEPVTSHYLPTPSQTGGQDTDTSWALGSHQLRPILSSQNGYGWIDRWRLLDQASRCPEPTSLTIPPSPLLRALHPCPSFQCPGKPSFITAPSSQLSVPSASYHGTYIPPSPPWPTSLSLVRRRSSTIDVHMWT
ncbi:hypothetical protein CC78DRAFT_584495 [Lojkania enalia]|uniref:Uncharacterized protein n=1 Tax=Lojkania enalia TaxID=147567 RepID=A0A9P4MWY4_9PLEO|nr:hypothetical protein CC78DRAFT_584495 [Didymosphaeria enalia]